MRKPAGFTLLEIMISVLILVIGLLGILALFPVAIHSGEVTIDQTTSSLVAQSVEQAIREGMHHRRAQTRDGKWSYFLFPYASEDPLPRRLADARPGADYYVLLPETDTRDSKAAKRRREVYQQGKTFVYPETDGKSWDQVYEDGTTEELEDLGTAPANGNGNAARADDDSDDADNADEYEGIRVLKTYPIGEELKNAILENVDDDETRYKRAAAIHHLEPYSFAFSLRRAFNDASLGRHYPISLPQQGDRSRQDTQIIPANELFECTVMIFKAFRPGRKTADPIYTHTFLVEK